MRKRQRESADSVMAKELYAYLFPSPSIQHLNAVPRPGKYLKNGLDLLCKPGKLEKTHYRQMRSLQAKNRDERAKLFLILGNQTTNMELLPAVSPASQSHPSSHL